MGYTSESENIQPSVDKIKEGSKDFQRVGLNIMRSNDWNDQYKDKVSEIYKKIIDLERDLDKLINS